MRGLKPSASDVVDEISNVALYMGAWIETIEEYAEASSERVALYMGAWIETKK